MKSTVFVFLSDCHLFAMYFAPSFEVKILRNHLRALLARVLLIFKAILKLLLVVDTFVSLTRSTKVLYRSDRLASFKMLPRDTLFLGFVV